MGLLSRVGATLVALIAAALVDVLWNLPWLLLPEPPDDLWSGGEIPWRSFLAGLCCGFAIALEQLVRIARSETTQLVGSLVRAGVASVLFCAISFVAPSLGAAAAGVVLVVVPFGDVHLFVFVFRRVRRVLLASEGLRRTLALCSSLVFVPVCGGAAVVDEAAAKALPADTFDGKDLVALVQPLLREACFEEVARFRSEAIDVALKRGLQRADAEDVVAGVMLATCKNGELHENRRKFFFGGLQKRLNDPWRRQKRWGDVEPRYGYEQPGWAPRSAEAKLASCYEAALETLPEPQRDVLRLSVVQGYTLDELTDRLGASRNTLSKRRQEGLAALESACSP